MTMRALGSKYKLRCARSTNGLDRDWTPAETAGPPTRARRGFFFLRKRTQYRPRRNRESSGYRENAVKIGAGGVMSSLSLLVSAPFHQNDRPASCFHAILETLLADSLRAAKGACLRARDPLLGRCHAVRQGEQGHAEHGGEDDCNNNTCHDFGLHKALPKSYGEISTRASVPGERAVLIQSFLFPPRREGDKIRSRSSFRFVSAFESINRRIPLRQKCHTKSFSNFYLLP